MNKKTLICPRVGMSLLLLGVFLSPTLAQELPPEVLSYADMVLYNGVVLTMDQDRPPINVAEAVAVREGRILAVGEEDRILSMAGPETRRVNLAGKTLIPGFIDTHAHPTGYARIRYTSEFTPAWAKVLEQNKVRLATLRWDNKKNTLSDLRRVAESLPSDWWILTYSWSNPVIRRELTISDLDQVAPNHPVFLQVGIGIYGVINTRMLEVIRERYGDKLIPGLLRDEQGAITGRLEGVAGELMDVEFFPQVPAEVLAPLYKRELQLWVANGVTTVNSRLKGRNVSGIAKLERDGELPVRFAYEHEIGRVNPHLERDLRRLGNLQGHGTDWMWLIGLTIGNVDGGGPRTPEVIAAAKYTRQGFSGVLCTSIPKRVMLPDDLYPDGKCLWDIPGDPGPESILVANRHGYRVVGVHSWGDRASEQLIDAYAKADEEKSIKGQRFAMDHGFMLRPDVIKKIADLGVMYSLQVPLFHLRYAGPTSLVYGEKYAHEWMIPVKSMIDAGVKVAYGADTMDDDGMRPLFNLEVLVTRRFVDGRVFGPRERLDRETALLMMTRWGGEYVLREDVLGSIEPGKFADLVILDKNPLDRSIPGEDLSEIQVLTTIVGGKVMHGALD